MAASPVFEFALLSFISLFTTVNPIGVLPVFTVTSIKLSPYEKQVSKLIGENGNKVMPRLMSLIAVEFFFPALPPSSGKC